MFFCKKCRLEFTKVQVLNYMVDYKLVCPDDGTQLAEIPGYVCLHNRKKVLTPSIYRARSAALATQFTSTKLNAQLRKVEVGVVYTFRPNICWSQPFVDRAFMRALQTW